MNEDGWPFIAKEKQSLNESGWPVIVNESSDPSRPYRLFSSAPLQARCTPVQRPGACRRAANWYCASSTAAMGFASTIFLSEILGAFGALLLPLVLVAVFSFLLLIYRAWSQIQAGESRATAREAALLLFVPLFHLYWVFVAYLGLARQINECMRATDMTPKLVNENVAKWLSVTSFIVLVLAYAPGDPLVQQYAGLTPAAVILMSVTWLLSLPFVLDVARLSELIARSNRQD